MTEKSREWLDALEYREMMEVLHAVNYVETFNHGSPGHLTLTTLAKLAAIVDEIFYSLDRYVEAFGGGYSQKKIAENGLEKMLSAPKADKGN